MAYFEHSAKAFECMQLKHEQYLNYLDIDHTFTIFILSIISGSNLLLLYEVREAAGEVLSQLIDHNNVLHILHLASTFSCRDLESKAHNFLLDRFEIISDTDEFLKLEPKLLVKYLGMDDIIVKSEESIFECITRWVDQDPDQRSQHFDSLITTVRFPLIPEQYLNNHIKSHKLVKSSAACEKLIKEAEIIRGNHKTGDPCHVSNVPQYRGSNQLLFLQSNILTPWLKNPPVLFDFKKTKWKAVKSPSGVCKSREGSCYVYHEGVIYSLGGEYFADADDETFRSLLQNPAYANVDRDIVLDNQVYSFTLEDMNWTVHSHMTTKRKRHQVSSLIIRKKTSLTELEWTLHSVC